MGFWRNQLSGPTDPARDAGWEDPPPRKGFFTDTSICIGCKACEVACKEWNGIPMDRLGMTGDSYDNSISLGASTWRHVAFVEQSGDRVAAARESGRRLVDMGMPSVRPPRPAEPPAPLRRATAMITDRATPGVLPLDGPGTAASAPESIPQDPEGVVGASGGGCGCGSNGGCCGSGGSAAATGVATADRPSAPVGPGVGDLDAAELAARQAAHDGTLPDFRWLMASDVCKHCTHAACLDVCPTGALFRTEFGTVVVQDDVCNGCGYCVPACPFGVIERRERPTGPDGKPEKTAVKNEGIAQKCTLCYDRLQADAKPACAQACPTTSIQFGDLDEMRRRAAERVAALHEKGFTEARVYGGNTHDGVGGTGSVFLLLDEPEVYGLPPDPRVTTADLPDIFRKAGFAGLTMLVGAALSFLGRRP
ncbi:4Fe-4S dicluster domain-containing protein [Mobilicoccus pelagius]|uniref:Putative formate dehydrogenase iron-sulfur subunit n=1 Tax=Mobilicoccus pelagius NBRC 104925 TaxID=1089455 RepID=H5URG3_9MICO|nr:4Fe-4S dicluster domain-containing protein [Mobilicoccus pelagius]GAB48321.1 putative formate dehydrogenase iron-sulfur subunit [Mobilicoccus pelagius NBRC 104925]